METGNIRGGYPVIFIVLFILLVVIFIVIFPMVLTMNTAIYQNSEAVMTNGVNSASHISDPAIRSAIMGVFTTNSNSFIDSQTIIGLIAQFGWAFVIVIIVTVIILLGRRQVETAGLI